MLNPKDPRLQKSDQSKQIHKAKDNDPEKNKKVEKVTKINEI